jgi:hypothetical protein
MGREHEGERASLASPHREGSVGDPGRRSIRIRRTIEHQEENA